MKSQVEQADELADESSSCRQISLPCNKYKIIFLHHPAMNSIASISLALLLLVVAAAGQSPYYIVENTFDNSDDCNMTGYYGVTSWVYR